MNTIQIGNAIMINETGKIYSVQGTRQLRNKYYYVLFADGKKFSILRSDLLAALKSEAVALIT